MEIDDRLGIFLSDWTFCYKTLHFLKGSALFPRLFPRVDIVTYVKCKTVRASEFSILPSVVTKYQVYSMGLTLKVCRIIRIYLVASVSKHYIKITEPALCGAPLPKISTRHSTGSAKKSGGLGLKKTYLYSFVHISSSKGSSSSTKQKIK